MTDRPFSQERRAKVLVGLVRIVGATAKLEVVRRRGTTIGERDHMMKLQKSALDASPVRPDKRALTAVA